MRIICKKGNDAKKALQFAKEYIEKKCQEYPLLDEDMEIEISLKDIDGKACQENDNTICIGQKELDLVQNMDENSLDYYNCDALTGLYNRGKYERDLNVLQTTGYECLTCVYIDAVGLHEINNHLGHKAGDLMLCCTADGIREYFPNALTYRIGGDEFVVLWSGHTKKEAAEKTSLLKESIRKSGYEISAGIGESTDSKTLQKTIDNAEDAMRYDKKMFYRNNGGERQMRSLNHKLEKLLLEKQDASHFLDVIAPNYKGVYMVNPEKDTCRYIYLPPYFQTILERNHGSFLCSLREYCYTFVRPEYYDRFEKFYDYDYIKDQLASGNTVNFTYQKIDGSWVELTITIYDEDSSETQEMLWIFQTESN